MARTSDGSASNPARSFTVSRSSLGLLCHGSQLEHVELGRALRPRDHQPPAERRDPLEDSGHVALGIVGVGQRLLLVAESQAAEEDQAVGLVILPQAPRGPLAPGLLDDGEKVALDLDVAEEGLEAFVGASLGRRLPQLDQPAIVASRGRRWTRQRSARLQKQALLANLATEALGRFAEGLL